MPDSSPCTPETIALYLDDALSPAAETAFEKLLDTCPDCREKLAAAAGSADDWIAVTNALRTDELDSKTPEVVRAPAWPLALLGPTDDPCMLGRIGPFEVSGCVGVGGMGVVFKARDPALDRYVAVKVLSPQLAASESARIRFAREAKAAAAVVHDNVIAVHQVAEYQGLPYLVMPYVPGPSLEDRLRRHGPMPVVDALRVARQVAAGLKAAHQQGLIHRDIKPANILLSGDTERAVITDFGLARAADDATLTRSGALAGTPQFMAPEQARGEPADMASDLFSLGALLFAMLTGRPPVSGLSGAETVRQVGSQLPPKLEQLCEGVPSWLSSLMKQLHCFDPKQRLSDAATAESRLDDCIRRANSQPLVLKRQSVVSLSSRRWQMALFGLAFASLLSFGWAAVWNRDAPKDEVLQLGAERPVDDSAQNDVQPSPTIPAYELEETPEPYADIDGQELDGLLRSIDQKLDQLENR